MGGPQRGKSRHARDVLLRRLQAEIELFFLNELVDERLAGVELTGIELSSDRRLLRIFYLPPEGREEPVAQVLAGIVPVFEARIAEVLPRTPELRFHLDRGASNERRVNQILEEMRERGELPPPEPRVEKRQDPDPPPP